MGVQVPDAADRAFVINIAAPFASLITKVGLRFIGLAGPAGAGKSSLAAIARDSAGILGRRVIVLSLDDFYLSRTQRRALGIRFRAVPGSHDLDSLCATLDQLSNEPFEPVSIPRFDAARDDSGVPSICQERPDVVILDGWFIGMLEGGYEEIVKRLDLLVHLRVPASLAKNRRFAREAALQAASAGFTHTEMSQFWATVLGPGGETWVQDAEGQADVLLHISPEGRLTQVTLSARGRASLRSGGAG